MEGQSFKREHLEVGVVGVSLVEDWSDIGLASIGVVSGVSEVMWSVPVNSELESGEGNLIDMNVSLKPDGLNSLDWDTMREVSQVLSIHRDLKFKTHLQLAGLISHMVVSLVDMNLQMELVMMLEWIVMTDLWSPGSVDRGVHADNMVSMEAEVDVEDNVRSAEKLHGEVLVMVVGDMSTDMDLGSSAKLFTDSMSTWNRLEETSLVHELFKKTYWAVDNVHVGIETVFQSGRFGKLRSSRLFASFLCDFLYLNTQRCINHAIRALFDR